MGSERNTAGYARADAVPAMVAGRHPIEVGGAGGDDVGTLSDGYLTPLLILLPGLDGTGILFRRFVEAIGTRVDTRIIAYPADEPLGYAELEALIRNALPTDRPYAVLGESFSGPIAIRLAADPPAGLLGLVLGVTFAKNPYPLFGWAGPWASSVPLTAVPGWVRASFMWGTSATERARDESERATAMVGQAVLQHRIAAVLRVDETDSLARIRIPTLVLQGSDDHVVPRSATEHIMRTLPTAERVEIRGPHMLLQIRAAECAAAVAGFMQGLQRDGKARPLIR